MAHIDAGKTTTTERILFYTGDIHRMGEVHKGTATMDWMEQERSAASPSPPRPPPASGPATTRSDPINIIDTPGPRGLHRRGRALACACSTAPSRCSTASTGSSRRARPSGARRTSTRSRASASSTRWTASAPSSSCRVRTIRERLGANPVCIQMPIGAEEKFDGVIDLVEMKALRFEGEDRARRSMTVEIPGDLRDAGAGVPRTRCSKRWPSTTTTLMRRSTSRARPTSPRPRSSAPSARAPSR